MHSCGLLFSFRDLFLRSRDYKVVALTPPDASGDLPVILIANSNVKHTLSGSEYPERVSQCREAVDEIKKK